VKSICDCSALLFILTISLWQTSSVDAGDNWPQFRGPSGNGHATVASLPTEWSESHNIAWKTPIHGRGWSSPVVWGDRVWLTTADDDGHRLYVLCIRLTDGKVLYDQKLFDVDQPQDIHLTNSHASPTPVVQGERVYVHFGSYGTACLNARNGNVLWQRRDFPCNHWRGPGSSPILFQDLLILHFDGYDYQYVVALEKQTGRTRWKIDRDIDYQTDDGDFKKAFCTPTVIEVAGQPQLISPAAKATIAYNPMTGDEIWRIRYRNHSATARPLFAHGLVYINNGFSKAELIAVRPDGTGDVTDTHVVWTARKSIGSKPSHLIVDNLLYVIHDGGTASCIEAKTGQPIWTERIGGKFSASPILADGKIYLMNEEGTTTVLAPGRHYRELAVNQLDEGCMASPAVVQDSLLIRTKRHLYRVAK
jgi:outer membrane protein assembly factor BamB